MKELQNFTNGIFNLDVKVEGEEVLFSAEQVAKSLGFEKIETRNGRRYHSIRWSTIAKYLRQEVGEKDFILFLESSHSSEWLFLFVVNLQQYYQKHNDML